VGAARGKDLVRYAILGDIHSNLEAFRAVLDAVERERPDVVHCTGDIVGYGASPRECVRLVRDLAPAGLVGGNHDWAVAGRLGLEYFNPFAREAIRWTRGRLDRDDVAWLGEHPSLTVTENVTVAHGTIHDPDAFDYLQSAYDAHLSFAQLRTPFAFVGHSHVPVTFRSGASVTYLLGERIEIGDAAQAVMNVGSVGQPRDEDPRAAFGIFDDEARVLRIHRVDYDIEAAAARIREAGLPEFLGDRLRIGR
jgi:diadenosine tetraphosphatase ApaH/serine/threonine PP2A family protein phosphatase